MYNLKQHTIKTGYLKIFGTDRQKNHRTGGAMTESGTPSKTQFSESKKSEKLASFMNVLSSKLAGSIHDALFRVGSVCGPGIPVVV